mmetsp:Transcript_29664/g.64593  ORF Transcript_29664/g.64593 Transcript_29664/m.64593 type:complete len:215 (-) Transcript_29664:1710-2354(-)
MATLSTSNSEAWSLRATSASICFTRMRSSASFVAALSLATSCCMWLTRVCSLPRSPPEPDTANFLSSAVFVRSCLRAKTMASCAARSQRLACSTASLRPSLAGSPGDPALPRAALASVIFATSFSAADTLISTSSRRNVRFLLAVVARNCVSRSLPSSRRFCSWPISSLTALAGPSVKRATSISLFATKVWASAKEAWTVAAILSASAMRASMS